MVQDPYEGELVSMMTKGDGSGNAYIFYLARESANAGVGTYVDDQKDMPLVPCEVNANGEPVKDGEGKVVYNSNYGLRAPDGGDYKLVIAHPAKPMISLPSGELAYAYSRNQQTALYISEAVPVTLSGVYLSAGGNDQYVFDASNYQLRQPRSRIRIKFACGDKIDSTTLRSVDLCNYIDEGYYIPVESRFHYTEVKEIKPLFTGPLTVGNGEAARDLGVNEYILSMDYSQTNSDGTHRWHMPSLKISTGDGDGEVTFNASLGRAFLPQNEYEFTILINSTTVTITMTENPWDDRDDLSIGIGDAQSWTITFPLRDGNINLIDWVRVVVDPGQGVI